MDIVEHVHFQLNAHALLCQKMSQLLQLNDGHSHSVITKFCEGQAQSFLPFVKDKSGWILADIFTRDQTFVVPIDLSIYGAHLSIF